MAAAQFLIVDDHPLFVEALQSALEAGFPGAKVDVAHTLADADKLLAHHQFNLILLDLRLPDVSGLEGILRVRAASAKTPLVIVSAMAGQDVIDRARGMGVQGFIHKGSPRPDIIRSVERLLAGEQSFPPGTSLAEANPADDDENGFVERLKQLTPQQMKVLSKVCEAKLNKQIAFDLGVTETTVKAHITLIFKKLKVHSRTQAVLEMQRVRAHLDESELGALVRGDS